MRRIKSAITVTAFAAALAVPAVGSGGPVKLTKAQMDQIVAAGLQTTTTQKNGGGNEPNGKANGVPTTTTTVTSGNGNAPPGQNK